MQYGKIIDQRTDRVIIETNRMLKNTYLLLSLTLMFSALTAAFSIAASVPAMNPILTLVVYFGLLFGIQATKDSGRQCSYQHKSYFAQQNSHVNIV